MPQGSCHCGAVVIALDAAPTQVTSCNCSICRRLGTLWAYDAPEKIRITGATKTYRWGDRTMDFHHCNREDRKASAGAAGGEPVANLGGSRSCRAGHCARPRAALAVAA